MARAPLAGLCINLAEEGRGGGAGGEEGRRGGEGKGGEGRGWGGAVIFRGRG